MKVTDCVQLTETTKRYSRLGRRSVKPMQEAKKTVKAPFAPVKNLIWRVERVSSQVMGRMTHNPCTAYLELQLLLDLPVQHSTHQHLTKFSVHGETGRALAVYFSINKK